MRGPQSLSATCRRFYRSFRSSKAPWKSAPCISRGRRPESSIPCGSFSSPTGSPPASEPNGFAKAFTEEIPQTPSSSLSHPRSATFVRRQISAPNAFRNTQRKETSYSKNWACFLSFLTGPSGSHRQEETINSFGYSNLPFKQCRS